MGKPFVLGEQVQLSNKAPKELRHAFGYRLGVIKHINLGTMTVQFDGTANVTGWTHEFRRAKWPV